MRWRWTAVACVVLAVVAGAVVSSRNIYEHTAVVAPEAAEVRGSFERYLYAITPGAENKKMAHFDPSLPAEEELVIGALGSLALSAYGLDISGTKPIVETIHEVNHITFATGEHKLLFELFKNSHGEVGAVAITKQ